MRSSKSWILFPIVCLLILSGCGSGSASSFNGNGAPAAVSLQGVVVDFGPTPLGAKAVVTSLNGPPAQPRNPAYHALGTYVNVHLGGGKLGGPVTFTFPANTDVSQVCFLSNGLFFPLSNQTRSSDGRVSGRLTFSPEGDFSAGLVEPPRLDKHVAWGSWNGYVWRTSPAGDFFEKIVAQGQPLGALPALGDHPLMIVHGLGSSIQGGTFNPLAHYLWEHQAASAIVAFEYDTLDAVQTNGNLLRQSLNQLGANSATPPNWSFVAHSMGTLVTRSAIEQPGPALGVDPRSRAVLVCGPHLGSILVDQLQDKNVFGDLLGILNTNDAMEFRNANGRQCQPANREAGLNDLRADSPYLAALNLNAADHHPQVAYYTMGGNERKGVLKLAAEWFGIFLDDGVVNLSSAGFPGLGQHQNSTMPFDHLTVNGEDGAFSFPEMLRLLSAP